MSNLPSIVLQKSFCVTEYKFSGITGCCNPSNDDSIAARHTAAPKCRFWNAHRIIGLSRFAGSYGAIAGGGRILRATLRMTFWGALALAITADLPEFFCYQLNADEGDLSTCYRVLPSRPGA
jgi:hypothetical protein